MMPGGASWRSGHAAAAQDLLDGAAGKNSYEVDAVRGIGFTLLALADQLGNQLSDLTDAVTDVQVQVSEVAAAAGRPGRVRTWPAGRFGDLLPVLGRRPRTVPREGAVSAGGLVLTAADMATIRQALADAAAWRSTRAGGCGCGGDAGDQRLAGEASALLARLGGGAS